MLVLLALCVLLLIPTPSLAYHMPEYVRASTYGNDPKTGYRDAADNDRPALAGASNRNPGIAMYRRRTLGGWYRVTAPNGRSAIIQHTDIGTAPSTGAQLDVNAVAARSLFGYRQGNAFPTKQGRWKVQYLGKKRPAGAGTPQRETQAGSKVRSQPPSGRMGLLQSYLAQAPRPARVPRPAVDPVAAQFLRRFRSV